MSSVTYVTITMGNTQVPSGVKGVKYIIAAHTAQYRNIKND